MKCFEFSMQSARLHGLIVLSLHVNYTEGNTKHTIFNHFQSHQFFFC